MNTLANTGWGGEFKNDLKHGESRLSSSGSAPLFPHHTHSKTSLLNCFCRLPRNSPIICRLSPFLCSRKWATPTGVSGTKPRSIRYCTPFSGFLRRNDNAEVWISFHSTWSHLIEIPQQLWAIYSITFNPRPSRMGWCSCRINVVAYVAHS